MLLEKAEILEEQSISPWTAQGGVWGWSKRGDLILVFAMSLVPAKAGADLLTGERGGGRRTCCQQHFCLVLLCCGWEPAVLGNFSSYCWLCSSGVSKETEQGGQGERVLQLQEWVWDHRMVGVEGTLRII